MFLVHRVMKFCNKKKREAFFLNVPYFAYRIFGYGLIKLKYYTGVLNVCRSYARVLAWMLGRDGSQRGGVGAVWVCYPALCIKALNPSLYRSWLLVRAVSLLPCYIKNHQILF